MSEQRLNGLSFETLKKQAFQFNAKLQPHRNRSVSSASFTRPLFLKPLHAIEEEETKYKTYPPASLRQPNNHRLGEFLSKMVFLIFYKGTDSYQAGLESGSMQHVQISNSCRFQPSSSFIFYTQKVLQTMQISCSTALLSLFYLHRLRPKVHHLFLPGTFEDVPMNASHSNAPYKRDARLEYRLFTIALILANKYLDDHSYSNRAWSEVTGLELRKINIMELEFIQYIEYSLLVKEQEYILWVQWLEAHIPSLLEQQQQPHHQLKDNQWPYMESKHHSRQLPWTPQPSPSGQRRWSVSTPGSHPMQTSPESPIVKKSFSIRQRKIFRND